MQREFDKISDKESYWGEVVDVNDPKKASRVRVRVVTVFDSIPVDVIPWAYPRYIDSQSHDLPAIGDVIQVKFLNDDIMFPTWYRIRKHDDKLSEDDYKSASVVIEKDLSKYELDGSVSVRYTKSEGLVLELKRDDNMSTIIIRNDNTVFVKNANTGKILHISNESLSIGSETISQQPAVVGNDNQQALEMLNNTIQALANKMKDQLTQLANSASGSPYTRHLAKPFRQYGTAVKSLIDSKHSANHNFFPETKSTFVTIDKT